MTTISSDERVGAAPEPAEISAVLRRAADAVGKLPQARVGRLDLYLALRRAGSWHAAQAALEMLVAHLRAANADDLWAHRWSEPRRREDAVDAMRAAAGQVPA